MRLHNIHLKFEPAESLPKVMGNPNQLEQVFLNIIINARDAVLEARTDETTFQIRLPVWDTTKNAGEKSV